MPMELVDVVMKLVLEGVKVKDVGNALYASFLKFIFEIFKKIFLIF